MAKTTMVEKAHDKGKRTNNKAEKNIKFWLKDHKPVVMINSYSLNE
jgi:hypothetical protein